MLVWFDSADIEGAFADLATSNDEFVVWMRSQIQECTGLDMAAPDDSTASRDRARLDEVAPRPLRARAQTSPGSSAGMFCAPQGSGERERSATFDADTDLPIWRGPVAESLALALGQIARDAGRSAGSLLIGAVH